MSSPHTALPLSKSITLVEDRLGMTLFQATDWLKRKFGKTSGFTLAELESAITAELRRRRELRFPPTTEFTDPENDGPELSL